MKKAVSVFLTLCLLCGMSTLSYAEESMFAGGSGTEEDPYQIATLEQMLSFAESVNDGSAEGYPGRYFVLTEDIDASGADWQPVGHMDLEDMTNQSCMFFGTFDGQGHTISNVTFDTDEPVCGAGVIGMNVGVVKNLTVENVQVHCTNDFAMAIGGAVGYNMGEISDVTLTGENEIAGVNCTGGIAGGNMGNVHDCSVDGTTICVLGDNDFSSGRIIQEDVAECGGLVIGGSFGGNIDNCKAEGTVTADGNEPVGLGGIAGCLEMMDSATNCTADVTIVTKQGGHAIGGLCGFSGTHTDGNVVAETEGIVTTEYPGIIDNCHVTVNMDIPGATHAGGLVGTGLYYYGEETAFRISGCSAEGTITGAVTPGAVAGRAENSVIESCETDITLDGETLTDEIGKTDRMYESADQYDETTEEAGSEEKDADPEETAAQLLEDLSGTYEELFPVICDPAYDEIWLDNCAAAVGEEAAKETSDMLKSACTGEIYGQEAVDTYGDGSEGAQFDCYFIGGVSQFVFDGNTISGLDENGDEVFSHSYHFLREDAIAGMIKGYIFEADDEDAGDFRYFFLLPDTPASTYHIEFRYGSDEEDLLKYNEGPLAYWLAAGIPTDRDEQLTEDVISLFCEENLSETEEAA